jgi:hypothetical protein
MEFRRALFALASRVGILCLVSCSAMEKTSRVNITTNSPTVVSLPPNANPPAQIETREPRQIEARNCDGSLPPLPEPAIKSTPPPKLTPEQHRRQQEVDRHWARTVCAEGWQIVATTQTPGGDIIDWVTIPGPHLEPPRPPLTKEDMKLPPGVQMGRTELELHPESRGPAGTTPITRPDFSAYVMGQTGAGSLQDYIEKHQVMSR